MLFNRIKDRIYDLENSKTESDIERLKLKRQLERVLIDLKYIKNEKNFGLGEITLEEAHYILKQREKAAEKIKALEVKNAEHILPVTKRNVEDEIKTANKKK
jgi:hypothetical protein